MAAADLLEDNRSIAIEDEGGQYIALASAMNFADRTNHSHFRVVEHKAGKRTKLNFAGENGAYYQLGNLKDLDYTIENPPKQKDQSREPPSLQPLPLRA